MKISRTVPLCCLLFVLILSSACGGSGSIPFISSSEPPQEIKFESGGKAQIVGSYYPGPGPNSPSVLLLHQWRSDASSWDGFARRLQAEGFSVLAIDGRGYGRSTDTTDGRKIAPNTNNESIGLMLQDVDGAVKALGKQENADASRIGIAGSSYGSSLALMYAAEHPEIKAVALLSPGLNYFGTMPTEPAAEKYGERAMMMVAAKDDAESADAVARLAVITGLRDNMTMNIFDRGGHGTALLGADVGLEKSLEEFFKKNL